MTTVESVKQDVQFSVGADASTVTFGASKVEVSPDGKQVTAYTNDGVDTKAATNGAAAAEGTLISVSKDFNTVVLNGVTIERAADGHLVIAAPGTVITKPGLSNDSQKPKALEIGDKREDGWAYVGVGEDGKDVFAKGYGVKKWKEAMKFAEGEGAHLGSEAELVLLQTTLNKGLLKDSFDLSGSLPSGWVWGSRRCPNYPDNLARVQRLSDGHRGWVWQDDGASTVLFRSEPRPGA
jgi:hypothetical protein